MNIAPFEQAVPLHTFSDLRANVWPNGEIAIYRMKKFRPKPLSAYSVQSEKIRVMTAAIANEGIDFIRQMAARPYGRFFMGLSPLPNSDKTPKTLARKGLKGITALGRRRVRNAAYLLQREYGRDRLTFSTVTIPSMALPDMVLLHQNWHVAIESYRLNLRRLLTHDGLSGEIVGVTEVQEKRHERTGLPVLHAHFVFLGGHGYGNWAMSPSQHDDIWSRAIGAALGKVATSHKSSCNLQQVRASAESYLGKYMSKGAKNVETILSQGYEAWLPKQWWNCSRSLIQWMEKERRTIKDDCEYLLEAAARGLSEIWAWNRSVTIDYADDHKIIVAVYGRLTPLGMEII